MVCRPAARLFVVGLLVSMTGCHAGLGGNRVAKTDPAVPRMSLSTAEAIEKHNINAGKVLALQAKPWIVASMPGTSGGVKGRMALELPKNFKLQMSSTLDTVADIGSNDDEFWFWTKSQNRRDNAVYVCSYDDIDRTPLSAAFKPEWIIESMGLRPITSDEAARMKSEPGDVPGTVKLISTRRGAAGELLTKVTILDQAGNVKEHQLLQGEKKTRIASAVVMSSRMVATTDGQDKVSLPYEFRLEWVPEKLTLDIRLDNALILPAYNDKQRAEIFIEPEIPGVKRANLAELAPVASSSARRGDDELPALPTPQTRTTRPAPVQLGSPLTSSETLPRKPRDPVSLSADFQDVPPSAVDRVVRPGLPRADDL